MKKRFFAMFCALSLLLTCIPFGAVFAAAEDNVAFRVGYAKVDINPWVDPADHTKGIMVVPVDSFGVTGYRFSFGLIDDDGTPGKQGTEGLWATCVAVTDDDDNTMLFISFDGIKAHADIVNQVRAGIIEKLGDDVISQDHIMINASHSHYTPALEGFDEESLQEAQGEELGSQIWANAELYKERLVENLINVAVNAMADRQTVSQVKKSEVDASDVFVSEQYPEGMALNGNRHYLATGSLQSDYTDDGQVETFENSKTWYAGDVFGCGVRNATGYSKAAGEPVMATYGSMGKYYIQSKQHVTESNDKLYMLEFTFDESLNKDTVMIANWRGHPAVNDKLDEDSEGNILEKPDHIFYYDYVSRSGQGEYTVKIKSNYISADYINAFRCLMKQQGYDVSFIQGASGNIQNESTAYTPDEKDEWGGNISWDRYWKDGSLETTHGISGDTVKGSAFAQLLVQVAQNTEHKTEQICTPGQIRSKQVRYALPINDLGIDLDDPEVRAGWTAAYQDAEENAMHYPYAYTHTDGTVYTFSSRYYVTSVKLRILWRTGGRIQDEDFAKAELNTIMLGEQIAFVTAPFELFDYYDASGSTTPEDNDWLLLDSRINGGSYGTPFVMGYTNGSHIYLPYAQAFDFNDVDKGMGTVTNVGVGAYESVVSQAAQGSGEKVVAEFGRLLQYMNSVGDIQNKTYYCEACDQVVQWQPLLASNNGDIYWYSGHYYLYEDMAGEGTRTKRIPKYESVCLDLNGHRLETNDREYGRAFVVEEKATLNIMDTSEGKTGLISGQGEVIAYNSSTKSYSYQNGGTIYIKKNATLNLYDGTIERRTLKDPYHETSYNAAGAYYKYAQYLDVDLGGTVYVYPTAKLNVYGGTITDGTAVTSGSCVYSHSSHTSNSGFVTLSNDADVAEVYFKTATPQNYLTIDGTYTGTASLTLQSATDGQQIGKLINNADISQAAISCANDSDLYVVAEGTNLVLTDEMPESTVAVNGGVAYTSVQNAVDKYTAGVIQLLAADTGTVTIPAGKTVTIDLNGFDLKNVTANGTLLVKDSLTDDYDVSDKKYGKITGTITGTVQAVPVTNGEGYLQVTEDEGVSFHKVHLSVTDMVMSASKVSIYYNCKFAGDEKVQGLVDQYGMAISLNGTPTVDTQTKTFTEDCQYSWFNDFKAGENKASSTRLYDIMKPDNGYLNNRDNANAPIYIRAYIKLKDGSYLLGRDYDRGFSLRNLLEAVNQDDSWAKLVDGQVNDLIDLYQNYTRVYSGWSIDNLRNAAKAKEDKTLKVLTLGHSLALDAGHMLTLVADAEGYEGLKVGTLYYSGCSLEKHLDFATNDKPEYNLYISSTETADTPPQITKGVTMREAIASDYWDIIIMQGGVFEIARDSAYTNGNIQAIRQFVNANKRNPNLKFAWNMTWVPPTDETLRATYTGGDYYNKGYAAYNNDRTTMYNSVTQCVTDNILTDSVYKFVIPSGTAMENALSSYLEETDLHRDYVHATDLGRVIASYTWYCRLTGVDKLDEIKLDAIPVAFFKTTKGTEDRVLTDAEKLIILESVNNALKNPMEMTQSQYTTVP